MTQILQKAFSKAVAMPAELQEQLAEQLLEDIEGEMKWDKTLAKSPKLLEQLAQRARKSRRRAHGQRNTAAHACRRKS